MANLNDLYAPAIDENCEETVLLSVSEVCFDAGVIEESEIIGVYLSEPDPDNPGEPKNPITGWVNTGLAANAEVNEAAILTWIGTVANTTAESLRFIKCIGDKPAPAGTDVTGPEGVVVVVNKKHSANIDVMTIDNLNYAFLQKMDANNVTVHLWYVTKSYIYGGINGVKAKVKSAPHVLARGQGSIAVTPMVIEWFAKTDPPRDANPA
jgi:hypothetical protein